MKAKISKILMVPLLLAAFSMVSIAPAIAKGEISTYTYGTDKISVKPMEGANNVYEFLMNSNVVMRYRTMYQGFSAKERAYIILERAENLSASLETGKIGIGKVNGSTVLTIDGVVFITVTEADYKSNNTTADELAVIWARNLVQARNLPGNTTDNATIQNEIKLNEIKQEDIKQDNTASSTANKGIDTNSIYINKQTGIGEDKGKAAEGQ
jgi:hypothetical protein